MRELSTSFMFSNKDTLNDMRDLDALLEHNDLLPIELLASQLPKRGFVDSVISKLDWYKTGSGGTFFNGCSDPGAAYDFPMSTPKVSTLSAVSSGGNLVMSKSGSFSAFSKPTSKATLDLPQLERTISRKRSLESSASESEEFQMDESSPSFRRRIN